MVHRAFLRIAFGVGVAATAGLLLAAIAWAVAGDAMVHRADVALHRHERLHFAAHLAAGRALAVCPCSRGRADLEYWKAARHAPTPAERALVTTGRPRDSLDLPGDAVLLGRYAAWLTIHDPAARTVALVGTPLVMLLLGGLGLVGWISARVLHRPGHAPRVTIDGAHPG
jgi:hypothetical protein